MKEKTKKKKKEDKKKQKTKKKLKILRQNSLQQRCEYGRFDEIYQSICSDGYYGYYGMILIKVQVPDPSL